EDDFHVSITFHGILPQGLPVTLDGNLLTEEMDISAPFRDENISPSGSLTKVRKSYRPMDTEIRPLSAERDLLPEERQIYELIATYEFSLDDDATVVVNPDISRIPDVWEQYESQLWMIHDKNRRLIVSRAGDKETVSLKKGDYTLRFHLRHDDPSMLEEVEDLPLTLDISLPHPVALKAYAMPDDARDDGPTLHNVKVAAGQVKHVYLAVPPADDLPDIVQEGDVLLGTMTLGARGADLIGSGVRPGGFPVVMTTAPAPLAEDDEPTAADDEADEDKTPEEKLAEEIRDVKIAALSELTGEDEKEAFDKLAAEILQDWPDYLPVLLAELKRADSDEEHADTEAITAAADRIINVIDQQELAAYFGVKAPEDEDAAARKEREEMEQRRDALTEALFRKSRALLVKALAEPEGENGQVSNEQEAEDNEKAEESAETKESPETDTEADSEAASEAGAETDAETDAESETETEDYRTSYEETVAQLRQWTDLTDDRYFELRFDEALLQEREGKALEIVNEQIEKDPLTREYYEKRIDLLRDMGLDFWAAYEKHWLLRRFPEDYPRF
ncbi:MAG TPA: hypothetical protein ENJ06_02990, partial [Phycisphaeraceae bacterium]|nr:hypothetical protein [Phycisphaeraceae bacterium]